MEHEYDHEEVCEFKKYVKQTLDLMVDAYKQIKNAQEGKYYYFNKLKY